MSEQRRSRASEAFFGRRHGKTLRPLPSGAVERLLPLIGIDLSAPAPERLADMFDTPVDRVQLEIGFGGGEHLLHRVAEAPRTGFIGVEPFVNGMAKLLTALQDEPKANIRVYHDDATRLLDWLPEASIDGLDLLYPDPWPKKKHWKRRFVNQGNLDRFARVLKPGGMFRFASDIDTYVDWTLGHMIAHEAFEWPAASADDWRVPYDGWPGTRYEAKAIREGRTPAYLTFLRRPSPIGD